MKRRTFMGVAAAALAIPALPAVATTSRITWLAGAKEHRHALLVAESLDTLLRDRIVYASSGMGSGFGYAIKLTDPRFVVRTGKPVWRTMDGYGEEDGLGVQIFEADLDLGEVGICSTAGSCIKELPPYYMRAPYLNYDETHELRAALGDRLGYDMRWLEHYRKAA